MKQGVRRRQLLVGCGAVLALAALTYGLLYHRHFSPEAREARSLGYDPGAYVEIHDLARALRQPSGVSSDTLARVVRLAHDRDGRIRARAVTLLAKYAKSDPTGQALACVRRSLTDSDAAVRAIALSQLHRFNAPEWRERATAMEHDPSPTVVTEAHRVLDGPG